MISVLSVLVIHKLVQAVFYFCMVVGQQKCHSGFHLSLKIFNAREILLLHVITFLSALPILKLLQAVFFRMILCQQKYNLLKLFRLPVFLLQKFLMFVSVN